MITRWKQWALLPAICVASYAAANDALDWSHYVRIAGHGLSRKNIAATIQESQSSHVFGIEVDNDVPGRYESFLDPTEKLEAIRLAAQAAHQVHNKAFVYIAGLECITAHADKAPHSLFKDHPDWVQRDREGKPAVFGGGTAFWITKGDEDVWISPYAPAWRSRYMELVRKVAETGIDGVYVDIPYWMTHFDNWEKSWASFDRYTVEAFRKRTGLDALYQVKLGDASDPGFRKWIDFRMDTITDFMHEIDRNVKSVNPKCLTTAEIFPGIESSVPRVGADVYQLYQVVDTVAHEYSGPSDSMGASRSPFNWLDEMVGMYTFRAFAGGKATWMLNYSWDGEKGVSIPDAMKTLFASQLIAGTNTWDAQGHVMSGSNDLAVRTEVFAWIAEHEHIFYDARTPIAPAGVYFSPETRDYYPDEFVTQFKAAINVLLLSHREFQVVTPRTLGQFKGRTLMVPDEERLSADEKQQIDAALARGTHKVALNSNQLTSFESLLEKQYGDEHAVKSQLDSLTSKVPASDGPIGISAPTTVISQVAKVNDASCVFLFNVKGLVAKRKLTPDPESSVTIDFDLRAMKGGNIRALSFLGNVQQLSATKVGGKLHVQVPTFERAMVVWAD